MEGHGFVDTGSRVLENVPFNLKARLGDEADTSNPEELIAAGVAACYSMALTKVFNDDGKEISSIEVKASLAIDKSSGVPRVASIHLEVDGKVPGVDDAGLQAAAEKTLTICPMVLLVQPGLTEGKVTLDARSQ